jgi:hypothetical protein
VKVWQQSEELLELPVEELQAIVGADRLNVKNEKVVWECVMRWIDHDSDNRKGHIVDLLKNIRLGLLHRNFLMEKVSIPLKSVCTEGRPCPNWFLCAFSCNTCKEIAPVSFSICLPVSI